MALLQYNFYPTLTPVRLASTSNIAGTYSNGPTNNGVGATLTIAASSLTIDGVVAVVGDRVLLQTQTNTFEQGIYVVDSIGSTVVLKRSDDMNDIENFLHAGLSVAIGAGSVNAGNFYTLVEPLPAQIGVSAIVFNADPSAGGVTFSGGPSTANALVVFSDAAGNIKPANAAPVTLGQNLAVTGTGVFSGALSSTSGPITSGSSGDAGSFISFPATAANGTLILEALNAGGAFNTTIRNSVMGQSSVISIPDPGAATANFVLTASSGGSQSIGGDLVVAGAIASTAGNITSGSSGDAGSFISFPATAANGTFIFEALNAGGAFNTTLRNSIMGQSSVISIPDPGAATANVLLDAGTNASGTFTTITVANTGLHILDTNASHDLIIAPGSDLTADRTLTVTTGDADRTLDISAASVTVSTFGASLVDDASNLLALTTLNLKRGDSDTWGGGGTSFAFTCAGIVATDVVLVSLIAAANNVAVTKCVAGAGVITVDFTADPGAGTIVNFLGVPTV